MKKNKLIKTLIIGITILFLGVSILPSISGYIENTSQLNSKQYFKSISRGTLYVGGGGPGNYTKIQDAIDNVSDGDTVFVYNGIYFENLVVDKSINLVGEDRNTTNISSNEWSDVVDIIAEGVTIGGFTIYCKADFEFDVHCMNISSNSIIINDNIIVNIWGFGIILSDVNNIIISNNIFKDTYFHKIEIENSNNIRITNNTFYGQINTGILGEKVIGLVIVGNTFINPYEFGSWDISLGYTPNCLIKRNTFNSYRAGIYLFNCKKCDIIENNFMDERQVWDIAIVYFFPNNPMKNKHIFDNNYWTKPRTRPKLIVGNYAFTGLGWLIRLIWTWNLLIIPIFHYDMNPAQEPFDIGG